MAKLHTKASDPATSREQTVNMKRINLAAKAVLGACERVATDRWLTESLGMRVPRLAVAQS